MIAFSSDDLDAMDDYQRAIGRHQRPPEFHLPRCVKRQGLDRAFTIDSTGMLANMDEGKEYSCPSMAHNEWRAAEHELYSAIEDAIEQEEGIDKGERHGREAAHHRGRYLPVGSVTPILPDRSESMYAISMYYWGDIYPGGMILVPDEEAVSIVLQDCRTWCSEESFPMLVDSVKINGFYRLMRVA